VRVCACVRARDNITSHRFSVCTLTVFNDGASDVALRLRNEWDIPNGVHVAKWCVCCVRVVCDTCARRETTGGVFSNNVWVVDTPSIASTPGNNATSAFVDTSFQVMHVCVCVCVCCV
jgi:hypothetical protein